MVRSLDFGFDQALALTLNRISPLDIEEINISKSVDRVAAAELFAHIDSPSVDASLKDGYAVISSEVAGATSDNPVRVRLLGCAAAGGRQDLEVVPGGTVQVLTGAKIPKGADAVVSEEFTHVDGEWIVINIDAAPGRNILGRGTDVSVGDRLVSVGRKLNPGFVGMLAAAGHSRISVFRKPAVGIVATGDEVVAPGKPLPEGKLYASNITALGAWCQRYGMQVENAIVKDEAEEVYQTLQAIALRCDALITSGGAWTGDRDLVAKVLDRLGWEKVFHRIRMGPGKAVGFGFVLGKPIFILPGGPPSNLLGFLEIALPGLMQLAGHAQPGLRRAKVRLASELQGRFVDWTQYIFGTLEQRGDIPVFHPLQNKSRLKDMVDAEAVVSIPEGYTVFAQDSVVSAQMLE